MQAGSDVFKPGSLRVRGANTLDQGTTALFTVRIKS